MVTMVTITKEATIVFTEEFILDKTNLFKHLPESLGGKNCTYRAAGVVLLSATGRHSWCGQGSQTLPHKKGWLTMNTGEATSSIVSKDEVQKGASH